jgi:hypothetical protein
MPAPNPAQSAWLKRLGIPSGTAVPNGRNRTTAPNPAPPATSPLPYANRPRTAGLWLCERMRAIVGHHTHRGCVCRRGCCRAQALPNMRLSNVDTYTQYVQRPRMRRDKGAACRALLAQLLYEHWAANLHAEQSKYPRYVDYLKAQLAGTE